MHGPPDTQGDACDANASAQAEEQQPGDACHRPASSKGSKQSHKGRRQMEDSFMMYMYKVRMCNRTSVHNYKLCPWAHPGETAALRRHPSCHVAELCPAVRQHQECPHGEGCVYSRNAFEAWLHPDRYRTTMCSSGEGCTRNICFFAHNERELRTPPPPAPAGTAPWAAASASQLAQQQQQQQQLMHMQLAQLAHNGSSMLSHSPASEAMMMMPQYHTLAGAPDMMTATPAMLATTPPSMLLLQAQQQYLQQLLAQGERPSCSRGGSGGGAGMSPSAGRPTHSVTAPLPLISGVACASPAQHQHQFYTLMQGQQMGMPVPPQQGAVCGSAPTPKPALALGSFSAPLHMALPTTVSAQQQQAQADAQAHATALLLQQLQVSMAQVTVADPGVALSANGGSSVLGCNAPALPEYSSASSSVAGGMPAWDSSMSLSSQSVCHVSNQSVSDSMSGMSAQERALLSLLPNGVLRMEGLDEPWTAAAPSGQQQQQSGQQQQQMGEAAMWQAAAARAP